MNSQINNKVFLSLKLLFTFLAIFFLLGCTGGNKSSGSTSNGGTNEGLVSDITKPKVVVISRTSVIPTNGGIGTHYIQVGNFTGEDLKLSDIEVIDTVSGNANKAIAINKIHKSNDYMNALRNTNNKHKNLDATACVNLQANGSCTLQFTPPSNNGSTAIKLTYSGMGANHKNYTAGQLINYSSQVSSNNGFLLSNKDITQVASTNDVLLSIPFVPEGDYNNLSIKANVKPIQQSVNCGAKVKRNQHCTALLRLPADSYTSEISISATNSSGKVLVAKEITDLNYQEKGNIIITGGPVVIGESELTQTLLIVNNGTLKISGLTDSMQLFGESGLSHVSCVAGLSELNPSNNCQVNITRTNRSTYGYANYVVKQNGNDIANTLVYYLKQNQAQQDYSFIVSIDNNSFVGVIHANGSNQPLTRTVTVKNIGKQSIKNIEAEWVNKPSNYLSIDKTQTQSTCVNKTLATNETCTYQVTYNPTSTEPLSIDNILKIVAKKNDNSTVEFSPQHQVAISTSTTYSVNNIVVTPANGVNFAIIANSSNFQEEEFTLSNTDTSNDFTLTDLSIPSGSMAWPSYLSVSGELSTNNGIVNNANITIPAAGEITFIYKYGPIPISETNIPSGSLSQELKGDFAGSDQKFIKTFKVGDFSSIDRKVDVSVVGSRFVANDNDNSTVFNNQEIPSKWVLKSNVFAQVQFKYQAIGGKASKFLVNDSSIPFGFTLNKNSNLTTCATTSNSNNSGSDLSAGSSCKVTYDYLSPKVFTNGYGFYNLATGSALASINAPGFSSSEGSNINVTNSSSSAKISINPEKFGDVSVESTICSASSGGKYSCTVKFAGVDVESSITVSPELPSDGSIVSLGENSCTINKDKNDCSLSYVVNMKDIDQVTLSYTYSLDAYATFIVAGGITFTKVKENIGALTPSSSVKLDNPQAMIINPNGKFAYAISGSTVVTYSVNPSTGKLTQLGNPITLSYTDKDNNQEKAFGTSLAFNNNNNKLYVGCQDNIIFMYNIDANGKLSPLSTPYIALDIKTSNDDADDRFVIYSIKFNPNIQFAYAISMVKNDSHFSLLVTFAVDSNGILKYHTHEEVMLPLYMTFSQDKKYLYISQQEGIKKYEIIEEGFLYEQGSVAQFNDGIASSIEFTNDGKYAYVNLFTPPSESSKKNNRKHLFNYITGKENLPYSRIIKYEVDKNGDFINDIELVGGVVIPSIKFTPDGKVAYLIIIFNADTGDQFELLAYSIDSNGITLLGNPISVVPSTAIGQLGEKMTFMTPDGHFMYLLSQKGINTYQITH